ncbi:MAG: type II 3-dehydroquinate dehydratase [Candidatus Nanopelagicales bacterium]|jgi:3-dehydroquinate dehydratase-2
MSKVLILNGPNLGRLGVREPEIYGNTSYAELTELCLVEATKLGLEVEMRQTDSEAQLVAWVHEAIDNEMPIVINAAAFTHYSYSLRDALAQSKFPVIEVHLSNPAAREEFRQVSVISAVCTGTISGFGPDSYRLALAALARLRS